LPLRGVGLRWSRPAMPKAAAGVGYQAWLGLVPRPGRYWLEQPFGLGRRLSCVRGDQHRRCHHRFWLRCGQHQGSTAGRGVLRSTRNAPSGLTNVGAPAQGHTWAIMASKAKLGASTDNRPTVPWTLGHLSEIASIPGPNLGDAGWHLSDRGDSWWEPSSSVLPRSRATSYPGGLLRSLGRQVRAA